MTNGGGWGVGFITAAQGQSVVAAADSCAAEGTGFLCWVAVRVALVAAVLDVVSACVFALAKSVEVLCGGGVVRAVTVAVVGFGVGLWGASVSWAEASAEPARTIPPVSTAPDAVRAIHGESAATRLHM
ncbi:hypothetical protein GZ176_10350 [Dermatophilus congolensis]|uniref:hypothetical protein n=1 Tax=Dermatophilus congolensis TaxID=1863 RepID=UPI001AAED4ED|nr:hypothetical protein [Dermatophilus congolensis]MBO3146080.1 hypothetical protein [Dermatophilus congolensis]MBO3148871.1 hypothetical protein [Dermatophilus congolensis]MBO3157306.1 hypothetical protein [Dermatophilus congolensis]MBO3157866.1 hypothetical protein [Dermatophilus congolensis]MBO3166343.1 hypothetical protein [Dermatophilus congolensis]